MKLRPWLTFLLLAGLLGGCARNAPLFNGEDLSNWTPYLEQAGADPAATWQVSDGVIHCTGTPRGYIQTVAPFADYMLHVEWRWPEKPGNSGILLHTQPPDKIWPTCIEAQLMNGNAGDVILMATTINEPTPDGKSRLPRQADSSEKPAGEWNAADILCSGDKIEITVNGKLQNKVTGASVRSGTIALQSEGAPIEFRNVWLRPLRD